MEFDCGFVKGNKWFRYRAGAIIIEDGYVLFVGNERDNYLYSVGGAVHIGESAEDAVKREVFEETGVHYEVDRLAFVHENFFPGDGSRAGCSVCHEVALYFLMKPRGTQLLHPHGTSNGVSETMHWLPIEHLREYRAFPAFLADYLPVPPGVTHIVSRNEKTGGKGRERQ